jgi:8-oxo-dGTP diphosphatase
MTITRDRIGPKHRPTVKETVCEDVDDAHICEAEPSHSGDHRCACGSTWAPDSDEAAFLARYDPRAYEPQSVTVDLAYCTIRNGRLSILLIRRDTHPFKGFWALPGGFLQPEDRTLEDAVARETREETGKDVQPWHIEQLGTYGDIDRDPRMRVISVAYLVFLPEGVEPTAGSDAADARFWAVDDLFVEGGPELAFDHERILMDAIERVRSKLEYTTLAATFLDEPFTLGELRRIYEAVWGTSLHPANFARKVTKAPGFLEPVGGGSRDHIYRRGPAKLVMPPLMRPTPGGRED